MFGRKDTRGCGRPRKSLKVEDYAATLRVIAIVGATDDE